MRSWFINTFTWKCQQAFTTEAWRLFWSLKIYSLTNRRLIFPFLKKMFFENEDRQLKRHFRTLVGFSSCTCHIKVFSKEENPASESNWKQKLLFCTQKMTQRLDSSAEVCHRGLLEWLSCVQVEVPFAVLDICQQVPRLSALKKKAWKAHKMWHVGGKKTTFFAETLKIKHICSTPDAD